MQKDKQILGMFNSLVSECTGHVAYDKKGKARFEDTHYLANFLVACVVISTDS